MSSLCGGREVEGGLMLLGAMGPWLHGVLPILLHGAKMGKEGAELQEEPSELLVWPQGQIAPLQSCTASTDSTSCNTSSQSLLLPVWQCVLCVLVCGGGLQLRLCSRFL
jgi:hypothetical protein